MCINTKCVSVAAASFRASTTNDFCPKLDHGIRVWEQVSVARWSPTGGGPPPSPISVANDVSVEKQTACHLHMGEAKRMIRPSGETCEMQIKYGPLQLSKPQAKTGSETCCTMWQCSNVMIFKLRELSAPQSDPAGTDGGRHGQCSGAPFLSSSGGLRPCAARVAWFVTTSPFQTHSVIVHGWREPT